ncbi:MAG: glycerophosphoryl diester phosphodiesterase membrane domain-containing protein [Clostridium sp.]|nr:glycerophosphoryl diester phosphodiesterase membrane domain-containing protein [Clostridium sp.]
MKSIKRSLGLFRYNMSAIILFQLVYKIMALALFVPLFYTLLNYSVTLAEIPYLTSNNMNQYFTSPSTYALLVIAILIFAMYFLIDISAMIYAMEASHRKEKTNPVELLLKGVFNAIRIINPKNMGIAVYVLLVLPFTYTVTISGSLAGFKLPEVFLKYIRQNKYVFFGIMAVYILVCFIEVFVIFTINYYSLYKLSYRESVIMGKKLIKHHRGKVLFGIIMWNLVITLCLFLLEGVLASAFVGLFKTVLPIKKAYFFMRNVVQIGFMILYIIFSLISTPLIYSYICSTFYELEGDNDYAEYEKIQKKRESTHLDLEKKRKRDKITMVSMISVGLILNGFYIYLSINNKVSLNIAYPQNASVTAHRGDSAHAPENTMEAIMLAVENHADIVEIDVRQTMDGEFIIMHDESLERTTGVDRIVGDVKIGFVKHLDAGIWFSEEYKNTRIPTLEEVLAYGKENHVFLNIELKPADTDENYEEGVLALIEKYEYFDDCMLASTDYELLKRMKQLNGDIQTLYILKMAFGDFGDMEYIDAFSVRHNFISKEMVNNIHKNGKRIYAWTINTEESIKKVLLMNVDGVISDDPYEAKEIIYNANNSLVTDWFERLVKEY